MTVTRTVVGIEGMHCSMCEARINDCIRSAFDVRSVKASRKRGEAVIFSAAPIDEAALRETIEKTGYTVTGVMSGQYEKKKLGFFRI